MLSRSQRPSVLVGGTDRAAATAYQAATSMALNIGTDIALTTIDVGVPVPWHIPVPFTAMRIPITEITNALVTRVAREIEPGPTSEPGNLVTTTPRIHRLTRPEVAAATGRPIRRHSLRIRGSHTLE